MTKLLWDQDGERLFETGVDRGVLYVRNDAGVYGDGVAWNGLTNVTESPSGAESNKQYADNMVYLNLRSAEEFGCTIEAFMYPDEFAACDGSAEPTPGVFFGQQKRSTFGFSWRSLIGNDLVGQDYGEKIHLAYGCDAAPSEKANATVNDSPEATGLSWEVTTSPLAVGTIGGVEYRPVAHLVIDSTKVDAAAYAELKDILYGTAGADPRLPLPGEVVALFSGTTTTVETQAPSYNASTDIITIPSVTGVVYMVDNEVVTGTVGPITADTVVTAVPEPGYVFTEESDTDWSINFS